MTKSFTTLGGESEILGGKVPPNHPRINTDLIPPKQAFISLMLQLHTTTAIHSASTAAVYSGALVKQVKQ